MVRVMKREYFLQENGKISSEWFEGIEGVAPLKDNDYIREISKFSFSVPSIDLRKLYMLDLLARIKAGDVDIEKASTALAIIISTSRLHDFCEMVDEIGEACSLIYEGGDSSDILAYVLSEDWGKFLRIRRPHLERIFTILLNLEYEKYPEISQLILKCAAFETGIEIINSINGYIIEDRYIEILEACVGSTGNLIKNAAFMTRRNKVKSCLGMKHDCHSRILDYSLRFSHDAVLQYSIISLALKTFYFDVAKIIRDLKAVKSGAVKYILTTQSAANLSWSDVQLKLADVGVPPYNRSAIYSKNLIDFYREINSLVDPSLSSGPSVCVIMTTYNPRVDLMAESIKSILNQTYKDINLIIIDDFSDLHVYEDMCRMLERFCSRRIQLHRMSKNIGQYACRNYAIKLSGGMDYIAIQDDDDVSHPYRIERQVQILESNLQAVVCMCLQVRFTEDLFYVPDRKNPTIFDPSPASTMFRTDVVQKIGPFADVRSRGDVEFLSRVKASYGSDSVLVVEAPLYLMRADTDTVSSTKDFFFKTQLDVLRSIMGNISEQITLRKLPYALQG